MKGSLFSRGIVALLLGVLSLGVGLGTLNATVIDDFSGTVNPPTWSGTPAVPSLGNALTSIPNAWNINFAPFAATNVNGSVVEPSPVSGVVGNFGRTTGLVANGVSTMNPISATVNGGFGFFSGAATTLTLSYTGPLATSTVDLSSATAYNVNFTLLQVGAPLTLTLTDINGKTATETVMANGPGLLTILANTLTTQAGFLAGLVTGINFQMVLPAEDDLTISQIFTTDSVPEPLALAIWALTGIGGVGMVRVCRGRRG